MASAHAAKELAVIDSAVAPEPAWLDGIVESGQAPLPGSAFDIVNQWHDVVAGDHVNVYAGARRDDAGAGIVVVEVTRRDYTSDGGVYPTPSAGGAVRIVDAIGAKLILLAANGARFTFDVTTRTYVA
jgi:hypothetical protein